MAEPPALILEGLVTTNLPDGGPHLAPLGPRVEDDFRRLVFRPFPTAQTWTNLERTGAGVFHVTDDVELLARAALHRWDVSPELVREASIDGWRLADCCRWYAFRATHVDRTPPRMTVTAQVVAQGRVRDFWGFNRAKHAVVEAAILATRVGILPAAAIRAELARLAPWVEKTGGPAELRAWHLVQAVLSETLPETD